MKKMNLAVGLSIVFSANVFSGTMGPVKPAPHNFFAALSLGTLWVEKNSVQTLLFEPALLKAYTVDRVNSPSLFGELFIGYRKDLIPQLGSIFGFAIGTYGKNYTRGLVYDNADPALANQSYQAATTTDYLIAKVRLMPSVALFSKFTPFFEAGIGGGYNHAMNFVPTAFDPAGEADPAFANNYAWRTAFTLGAGLSYAVSENTNLGIKVQYVDSGRNYFAPYFGQTTNQFYGYKTAALGWALELSGYLDPIFEKK